MPLVFVHGVSNRDTPDYRDNRLARDAFLQELVVPALGLTAENVRIFNPYWGDDGVKFRWGTASLPESSKSIETFGGLDPQNLRLAADVLAVANPKAPDIIAVANCSLADAIEIVWSAALSTADTAEVAMALAASYKQARQYAAANPKPEWLATAKPGNLIDQLLREMKIQSVVTAPVTPKSQPKWEQFGRVGLGKQLNETFGRIASLPSKVLGSAVLTLGRKRTHLAAAQFVGDVFEYLDRRGNLDAPGPIVEKVLHDFRVARGAMSPDDPQLIVIAHSLGGVISYDILSYFDPNIPVDVLVTVGSQVALFAEMALYRSSQLDFAPTPASDRLPRPPSVQRWLNVLDPNDIFGFRAEGVFAGVQDFVYETGYGVMSAHSGYFRRPSFYERLGDRLAARDG